MKEGSLRLLLVAAVAALLLVAACGSGNSKTSTVVASPAVASPTTTAKHVTLEEGMDKLYKAALANKETEVLYTVSTGQSVRYRDMVKLFNEKFPEIAIKFKETDFLSMGAVLQTELNAGQRTGDLANNAFLGLKPLVDAGNILYTDWAQYGVSPDRIQESKQGGFGVIASESLCNQTVWNRKYVQDADIPATIEGFSTDPKWKGKMVTEPNNAYACFGFRALRFGVQHEIDFAKALKANGLLFSAGYSQLFGSGERPVAMISNSGQIAAWKAAGIDVGEKVYPGSGVIESRAAVVKATKVPNAAKLIAVWLTTPAASRLWEKVAPGSGFISDPDSPLYQHVTNDLKLDVKDHNFFLYETSENFNIRAETAAGVAKAVS
jgi:ABC-type glycerol-3-phosphate transport system substrate-binding protein